MFESCGDWDQVEALMVLQMYCPSRCITAQPHMYHHVPEGIIVSLLRWKCHCGEICVIGSLDARVIVVVGLSLDAV